jgi:integrase
MMLSNLPRVAGHKDGARRVAWATLSLYETAVTRLINFLEGDIELANLSAEALLTFHEFLRDDCPEIRTATANSYRRTLAAMFRAVGRDDLARPLKQLREAPRRDKAMEEEHLRAILAHASLRDAALVMFLAASGARRGTVCRLRKDAVRIWQGEDGRFRLAARVLTKGDSLALCLGTHEAALAMMLWLAVQPNSQSTGFVFTVADGSPLAPRSINSIFNKLKAAARLPADAVVNPHSLRHKFAQEQLGKHDAAIVAALMNHSSPNVTLEIYAQRSEAKIVEAFFGGG